MVERISSVKWNCRRWFWTLGLMVMVHLTWLGVWLDLSLSLFFHANALLFYSVKFWLILIKNQTKNETHPVFGWVSKHSIEILTGFQGILIRIWTRFILRKKSKYFFQIYWFSRLFLWRILNIRHNHYTGCCRKMLIYLDFIHISSVCVSNGLVRRKNWEFNLICLYLFLSLRPYSIELWL